MVYDIDGKVLDSMLCKSTIFINAWVLDEKCYEVNMYIMFPAIVLCCSKYIYAMLRLPHIHYKKRGQFSLNDYFKVTYPVVLSERLVNK